jgi:hypothetical protein
MAHFAYFDEETVLQLTTNGPWGIEYINPRTILARRNSDDG